MRQCVGGRGTRATSHEWRARGPWPGNQTLVVLCDRHDRARQHPTEHEGISARASCLITAGLSPYASPRPRLRFLRTLIANCTNESNVNYAYQRFYEIASDTLTWIKRISAVQSMWRLHRLRIVQPICTVYWRLKAIVLKLCCCFVQTGTRDVVL